MLKLCSVRFYFIAALLPVLGSAPHSSAQQLIPDHFASWESDGRPPLVMWPRSAAAAALDSHPEYTQLLVESAVVRVEERGYKKGSSELGARVYQLRDPSSAYEVYTSRIGPSMQPSPIWSPSAIGDAHLILLIGNMVVEVADPQNASREELQQFGNILKQRSDQTPLPPIRAYLPEGFADGTQRYALGPAGFQSALQSLHRSEYSRLTPEIGFSNGAEAMLADYRGGKDNAALLLIEYPTPQLAEQHLHHLQTAMPDTWKQAGTTIERKASLLSIVMAPSSPKYAENLRQAINYETQVTWHEPTHTITDPPILTSIAKIIISTGVFMVVAFVLGVAFGGVRVLTKIFFPGKVFDRPERMDVLQLGLSSKRINSRDFY